ncbi:HAD-IIIC family phosphatase [Parvularcula marina]|nr:HAD-IIIC family phosphatase [Parvularcula marina]
MGADIGDSTRAPIALAASYTLGPVLDHLSHLAGELGWPVDIRAVPYGRFAAQLSDAEGSFWAPASRRFILLRPQDIEDDEALTVSAVWQAEDGIPLCILIGHDDPAAENATASRLKEKFHSEAHIDIVPARHVFDGFGIGDPGDELTNRTGHLPYTESGMAALALYMARIIDGALRPPVKLIAVDGDNTIWGGVLGEDGVGGVRLDEGHLELQQRLKSAAARGVILTLLTKNESTDIRALLLGRSDFPLGKEDFFEVNAGWGEKSAHLARLAATHGVGQEAILFLDDNPVELARMREAMPGVLTVGVPEDGPSHAYLDGLWPFDQGTATTDDEKRVRRLREEAGRQAEKAKSGDLDSFYATLGLRVEMFTPGTGDVARIAQLSQRTNQFNSSLLRLTEGDVASRLEKPGAVLRAVNVADRFGDYGLVGLVIGDLNGGTLSLDLFCLSCRVLGRGVEHDLLRQLMADTGARTLRIRHVTGPRNAPMRRFLDRLEGSDLPEEGWLDLSTEEISQLRFDPAEETGDGDDLIAAAEAGMEGRGAAYQRFAFAAHEGTPVAALSAEQQTRPMLETTFQSPRGDTEVALSKIWQDVLGIEQIGRTDSFTALGGKSLHLVRIHARMTREMEVEIALADLFRFPTIEALARHLGAEDNLGFDRAAAMRAARMRRPRRVS